MTTILACFIWKKIVWGLCTHTFTRASPWTPWGDIFSVLSPPCAYFFSILSTIKMIFGQILVCFMTNISSMFWAQCWRLETSSRPFYDFVKMTIYQDLAIFNSWYLPFLNVPYSPFQKNETLES